MHRKFVLFALTLFLAAAPVNAKIIWEGKHNKHEKKIESVYKQMPERGKEIDVKVREVPEDEWTMVDDFYDFVGVIGIYFIHPQRLYLQSDHKLLYLVFAHEYGHHVWFTSLTTDEQDSWIKFWEENQDKMPRDYARVNPREGFAECFMLTYFKGEVPDFYNPIDQVVKDKILEYFK
ncbi:MAG: hypothetical protein AABY07_00355 [Nanoarchaeota archaeon]